MGLEKGEPAKPAGEGESLVSAPKAKPTEIHHRIPRSLLTLHDRAHKSTSATLTGEDIEAWLDYEAECCRYGVEPCASREDLVRLIEDSALEIPFEEHRKVEHAGDWTRWGRLGGTKTYERYGPGWFALLAKRRWKRIEGAVLVEYRSGLGKEEVS